MLKRTLSIILAVAMLCTLVPAYALAEEVAEENALVENEEIVVADEAADEDLDVVPMASFSTALLVDENGAQQPAGIKMPETLSNVNVSAAADKLKTASVADLPSESITYVLVDSDNDAYSNFTSDYEGTWITTGSGVANPWIDSVANTRRGNDYTSVSEHTATIVVPESVGPEGKEFQVVGFNIRTAVNCDPSRYGLSGRGALVWIDGVPVATDITKGHDCIGEIQSHMLWIEKGMVDWTTSASGGSGTYYVWEWGPTVTLTPGVHTVKFQPAPGSAGGRVPGFIITDAIGYDWTKIVPIMNKNTVFTAQTGNAGKDFVGAFGPAGYLDFAGPKFDGNVVVDTEETDATTLVFSVPEANDVAETKPGSNEFVTSAYSFAPVTYKAYVGGKEVEIVDGVVTVDGLAPDTTYDIKVVALDMLGNDTELTASAKTLGAEALDYAFFSTDATIKNMTALADAETKLAFEWTPATAGLKNVADPTDPEQLPEVSYNVYVDGTLKANTTETNYTVNGLSSDNTYDIKVVTCLDGVEADEKASFSSLEASLSTARTPKITEVADQTTATSTVLEVSSLMDPASFNFEIKEVILNGEVTDDVSIEGNLITVNGLLSGAPNTIKVTTKETQKSTNVPTTVVYPLITVKTPAAGSFTLTSADCTPVSSTLPVPMCYDTLSASDWPTEPTNTNGGGLWPKDQVWRSDKGSAKATVNIREAGNYYAYTQTYQYDTPRYFTATINGTSVKNTDGNAFKFAKDGVAEENKTSLVLNVCPQPIALEAGDANIVLGNGNGVVRASFFALIPASYAYDANDELLDPAGEYESIRKFIKDTFGLGDTGFDGVDTSTARKALMDFYIPDSRILNENSLEAVSLTEDSVLVKWAPTTFALGKDITYSVYLDGKKCGDVSSTQVPQYVFEGVQGGTHTISVKASADAAAQDITVCVGGVVPTVSIDKEDGSDGKTTIDAISVELQNLTGTDRNIAVVVATFNNGKMKIEDIGEVENLTYGNPQTISIELMDSLETILVGHSADLDASKSMTKIFVVDADTFVPYAY